MRIMGRVFFASVFVASLVPAAQAADPIAAVPEIAAAPVALAADWEGFYAGFNLGYSKAYSDHIGTSVGDMDMTGPFAGGQLGYNLYLSDGVVLGFQGDLDWANITGTYTGGPTIDDTINWTGALTAHLGFASGSVMPYLLGGVAFANSERTSSIGPTTETLLHTGYTIGAGVEFMLAEDVSGFAEFRHSNYGSRVYDALPSNPEVNLTDNSVRAGLNFHF